MIFLCIRYQPVVPVSRILPGNQGSRLNPSNEVNGPNRALGVKVFEVASERNERIEITYADEDGSGGGESALRVGRTFFCGFVRR